jgi:hypothetical protein
MVHARAPNVAAGFAGQDVVEGTEHDRFNTAIAVERHHGPDHRGSSGPG